MEPFFVVVVVVGVGYTIAFTRKGKVTESFGSRRLDVYTPADPATVFERLGHLDGHVRVDDKDQRTYMLVLSSPVTAFTWGFLYPVLLEPQPNGGTRIVVGCKSKVLQIGPFVTHAHARCVKEIERALSVPAARVA